MDAAVAFAQGELGAKSVLLEVGPSLAPARHADVLVLSTLDVDSGTPLPPGWVGDTIVDSTELDVAFEMVAGSHPVPMSTTVALSCDADTGDLATPVTPSRAMVAFTWSCAVYVRHGRASV